MGFRRIVIALLVAGGCASGQVDSVGALAASEPKAIAAVADTVVRPAADTVEQIGEAAQPAQNTSVVSAAPPPPPPLVLDQRQRVQITGAVKKKRAAVIAGSALLAAGALIDYGLVYPAAADLDPLDLEGQLALISPIILAFGLRAAGPPMAAMRTSEVADVFERQAETEASRNWSWYLYYGGWGFYAASLGCGVFAALDSNGTTNWEAWGTAMSITSDLVWAATCAYAWYYLRSIGKTVEAAEPRKVSIAPFVNSRGAAGAGMMVRF
jgi:hypothetical protein